MKRSAYHFVLAALVLVACGEPLPRGPSHTLRSYPHITDRYARLLRRQLIDPDPMNVQQQITCEIGRIGNVLGLDEARLRIAGVEDTIYRTRIDSAERAMVERAIAYHSFEVNGALCDSLVAVANREDPIVRADTSSHGERR